MAPRSILLVDALVRQTVVLIATLATGAGQRHSLSHVADRVFSDLVGELRQQGLSNKVIADMFGMALRTYQGRVAQLAESRSEVGRSLWEAVFSFLQQEGPALRAEVLARFGHDDPVMVRAVLRDLCESGIVQRTGSRDATRFEARGDSQSALPQVPQVSKERTLQSMVRVAVHRHGPLSPEEVLALLPGESAGDVDDALSALVAGGLAERALPPGGGLDGGGARYHCERCVIPFGDEEGWEAAVFDHFQAMVAALVTKLRRGKRRADLEDAVGGSTFVFDLHEDHPMRNEVLEYLKRMRQQGLDLRARLDAHQNQSPQGAPLRVIAYVGQTIAEQDDDTNEEGIE